MRRVAIVAAVLVGCLAFMAAPALATFHLNMVNEVMLASSGGDTNVRFVELLDRGGSEEAFPPVFAPYKLVVYDAAGNKLGEQTLNANGLRAAAALGREYLVSTPAADAAFGVTGDERLNVTLPIVAGQACYEANTSSPTAYSCLTWGTIIKPVPTNSMGTGSAHGPTPPNGESDQRQPDGSVVAAPPTPRAPNHAGTSGSGGMGGNGGGGGSNGSAGFRGVSIASGNADVGPGGRTHLKLRCPRGSGGCSGRVTLTATIRRRGSKLLRVEIASAGFRLAAGSTRRVSVKLTRGGRRLLRRLHRLRVRAVIVAHDRADQTKRSSRTVLLIASRR